MVILTEKSLAEYKRVMKKEYRYEPDDKEAREGAQNLLNFFEVLYEVSKQEYLRKQRLKKKPKGFHLEEGKHFNCLVCSDTISGTQGWWDLGGAKCLNCQRAVDKKIIPKMLGSKRESWYSNWELKNKFGIHPSSVGKLVREGRLKSRNILNEAGGIHYRVFLKKENQHLTGKKSS